MDDIEAEIILMVDNREKRNNNDINYFFERFQASNIRSELKSLPLGDFLWILRIKNNRTFFEDNTIDEILNPNPDIKDEN